MSKLAANARDSHQYSASTIGNACWGAGFLIAAAIYTWRIWPSFGMLGALTLKEMAGALLLPPTLFGIGFWRIANAIFGFPRLRSTQEGIELETLFGRRWASWHSVSVFANRGGWAIAAVIGTDAKVSLLFGRNFTIYPSFSTPIATIVSDLNARRAEALCASTANAPPRVAATAAR